MNFKKLAVTSAAAALLFSSVVPALANYEGRHHNGVDIDVENHARVTNNVLTVANTGFNEVGSNDSFDSSSEGDHRHHHRGGSINTGDAWAGTSVVNDVNFTQVDLCGCRDLGKVEIDVDNNAHVNNNVLTVANSGFNYVDSGRIRTGNAGAEASVVNFVNTTIVGGGSE